MHLFKEQRTFASGARFVATIGSSMAALFVSMV